MLELTRQEREIRFMNEFLKEQANQLRPVEFLSLWAGYNQMKSFIQKQRTTISDIQTDLKLNGRPITISDSSVKDVDIEHINPDK